MIWFSLSRVEVFNITKVYYMGCGIGCFLRVLVSFYIGLKDKAKIISSMKSILFYKMCVSLFFSLLLFFVSRHLGNLFLSTDKELDAFVSSMNIFALHLPFCMCLASMTTIYRWVIIFDGIYGWLRLFSSYSISEWKNQLQWFYWFGYTLITISHFQIGFISVYIE